MTAGDTPSPDLPSLSPNTGSHTKLQEEAFALPSSRAPCLSPACFPHCWQSRAVIREAPERGTRGCVQQWFWRGSSIRQHAQQQPRAQYPQPPQQRQTQELKGTQVGERLVGPVEVTSFEGHRLRIVVAGESKRTEEWLFPELQADAQPSRSRVLFIKARHLIPLAS
ncbi:hypothetical protein cyc_03126 [Cyclospora cayetanensis]|uniref:Uncharacterized protein n=1 Tax=Cyclospora cayetanensis TaxID=88456 RepID=A0A1D3CZ33_9EIME|nr:hypothetical protein cyc_03126 [Cyclospora cayetanensis]